MQLSEASIGTDVLVVAVEAGDGGQGRRLEDLGFVVGTRVRVDRRAPLGDPTVYELGAPGSRCGATGLLW